MFQVAKRSRLLAAATLMISAINAHAFQNGNANGKVARERILELSLTKQGFSTPTVTLEEGSVILVVNNRTRHGQLSIRLDRNDAARGGNGGGLGTAVAEGLQAKVVGLPWQQKVQLNPGTYTLKDATTGGSITLEVTPKK